MQRFRTEYGTVYYVDDATHRWCRMDEKDDGTFVPVTILPFLKHSGVRVGSTLVIMRDLVSQPDVLPRITEIL